MFSLIYDLNLISNTDQECGSTWPHRYGFVLQGEKSGISRSHCEHKSFRKTWKAGRDCVGDCISVRRRGKLGQWANLEGEWGDDGWLGNVGLVWEDLLASSTSSFIVLPLYCQLTEYIEFDPFHND
jgi:hypothetical protein